MKIGANKTIPAKNMRQAKIVTKQFSKCLLHIYFLSVNYGLRDRRRQCLDVPQVLQKTSEGLSV